MPLVMFWALILITQLLCGAVAFIRARRNEDFDPALVASAIVSVLPLFALLMFVRVFVIGGSSNVAQFAGADGAGLWSEWFHAWPLFFFGGPVVLLVTLVAALFPPYPPRQWVSSVSRLCAIASAV